jgi:hypothetical protein
MAKQNGEEEEERPGGRDDDDDGGGGGVTTEDMQVLATMVDPSCLPTEFSLHRNRRALLNVFPLGCFSNNHRQLIPLFAPVCELIVVGNGDEGLNALALSFLADCAAGRSEYRAMIAKHAGVCGAAARALSTIDERPYEAVSAAAFLRNVLVICHTEWATNTASVYTSEEHNLKNTLLREIHEAEIEPALVSALARLRASHFRKGAGTGHGDNQESALLSLYRAQECLLGCICNVAGLGPTNIARLVEAHAIPIVLRVMASRPTNEVQAAAADAMCNMARDNGVGETLLQIRDSSSLFTMATHSSDLKVSKSASDCLANVSALAQLEKSRIETVGTSFLQRLELANMKAIVRSRLPEAIDAKRPGQNNEESSAKERAVAAGGGVLFVPASQREKKVRHAF